MTAVDLARFQFAWTSVNHFFFVPVTIGLAFLTALLQTSWYQKKNPELLRLTRFFGTLLLISVAVGVVTGLVQEFEFGMNWGAYSRLVGNVFGAPLAMEGLAAFFLESTFLGLWIFGWDKLSRRRASGVHLAGGGGQHAVGGVHPGGEFVDAASGRLQDGQWEAAAGQHRRGVHQPGVPVGLHQGDPRLGHHWHADHAGGVGVAAAQGQEPPGLRPLAAAVADRAGPGDQLDLVRGRHARRGGGHLPADEDRGGGGPVDHLPAVLVLAVPDRRRQQRPDPDRRSSRSRTCCRCWPRTRGTARWRG